ncbi:MAG: MotA/TolQ/ExbB proton channel family protein [bacterium]
MDIQNVFFRFALLGAEWVMWLLVGLSVISVAIMVERAVVFRRLREDFAALTGMLLRTLRAGDTDSAIEQLAGSRSVEAAVAAAGLREAGRGAEAAEEAMAAVRVRERQGLERNLAFLGTVGNNAPFIGLFGTVLGIIKAFDSLSGSQTAGFKVVMGDISEALVATGVGLMVAIPAVVAFNIFSRRARKTLSSAEAVEHLVLSQIKGTPMSASPDRAHGAAAAAEDKTATGPLRDLPVSA